MCLDPAERLSAQAALQHRWIVDRAGGPRLPGLHFSTADIHINVLRGLQKFHVASKLQRSCLLAMAHSMTHRDIVAHVRDYFLHIDAANSGAIHVEELADAIRESVCADDDTVHDALLAISDAGVFRFSDFLASMVPSLIKPQQALIQDAFRRFSLVPAATCNSRHRVSFSEFSQLIHDTSMNTTECATSSLKAATLSEPSPQRKCVQRRTIDWAAVKRRWSEFMWHLKHQPSSMAVIAYQDHFYSKQTDLLHG